MVCNGRSVVIALTGAMRMLVLPRAVTAAVTAGGSAGLSTGGSQCIGNAGTSQTGGRTSCVEGRTNGQRSGSGRGRRSAGGSVGRSAAAGPASQPRSQNRSDSRDQRASERSGAQRSGPRAAGARGQKGGPSSCGGKAAGDSNARKLGPRRPNFQTQTTSSVDEAPRPRPHHWLTLAYEEVSDEFRKELADFVGESLEGLGVDFPWQDFESVVQALIDRVASKCESCMGSSSTARNRSVNPNQGWRWRKQKRRRENSSQDTTPDSQGGPESPVGPKRPSENSGHRRGNNSARPRRCQAAG